MSDHTAMTGPARAIAFTGAASGPGRAAAVRPGTVRTDPGRRRPRIQVAAMPAVSISARKGAGPVASLAANPAAEPGAYRNRFTATRSPPSHTTTTPPAASGKPPKPSEAHSANRPNGPIREIQVTA